MYNYIYIYIYSLLLHVVSYEQKDTQSGLVASASDMETFPSMKTVFLWKGILHPPSFVKVRWMVAKSESHDFVWVSTILLV